MENESPNEEAQRFYDLLTAANQPIYEGASVSKLSTCVSFLELKSRWNLSQKCLDELISLLVDAVPPTELLPKNFYDVRELVSMLGLKSQKIDCCVNGCMLYYKNNSQDRECSFCHEPRYVRRKIGKGKYKDVAVKRMIYLPITPRLQRLYASTESAAEMRWHHKNRTSTGVLRHPSDGDAWKHFDVSIRTLKMSLEM